MARTLLLSLILCCVTPQDSFGGQTDGKLSNQEMAEKIAGALRTAKLQGSDIEIEYRAGKATLTGFVVDTDQKKRATIVISRIPGVTTVINSLKADREEKPTAPERTTQSALDAANQGEVKAIAEKMDLLSYAASQNKMGNLILIRKLLVRQRELFESDSLHKIEVSVQDKDKSTPKYDIYCGRKQFVVFSHTDGYHYASFEGSFLNSFQGGVYAWKSGKRSGTQYECEKRDLLQLLHYMTDLGGMMTQLYIESQTHPERFQEPITREDGAREHRLKQPRDGLLSMAAAEDPLWLCELTYRRKAGDEFKYVYNQPVEVEQIPESIARELKEVTFKPTKRTVHSLMVYP